VIDIAFALQGRRLPREHRRALADAVHAALPWLAAETGAGVHPLKLPPGGEVEVFLSQRTRLVLRVPRRRQRDALALQQACLDLGTPLLRVGPGQVRELLPFGTLYAQLVADEALDEEANELHFLQRAQATLHSIGVPCRAICGRRQVWGRDRLQGYSLMLDGLGADAALRVMQQGLGPHRQLGCGVFVAHRSAAAVGMAH